MSDPCIPTASLVELINAHTTPPRPGDRVLALNHGGVLVPVEVKTDFLRYFDAWCAFPRVPADVKAIQSARYAPPKEVMA